MIDLRDWLSEEDVIVSDTLFGVDIMHLYFDITESSCKRKRYDSNLQDYAYELGDCIVITNNSDDLIRLEIVDIQNDVQTLNLITDNYVSPVDGKNLGDEKVYRTKRYKWDI